MKMMKTVGASAIALLACASFVQAGTEASTDKKVKELKQVIEDQGIYVETAKKGIKLSGYVDVSYSYNANGGGTDRGYNGTPGYIKTHQFDVDSNDFNVNQVKIALEKALPDENVWAAGFRVDLIFGEDAKYIPDNDGPDSSDGYAIEQAYVQFRVPVGNGLDFKFGKFVTLMGFEVIETPANLNVSRGYVFTYALPLTHTGILASYKFSDLVDAQLGIVNGWNNSDSNFLDEDVDGKNGDEGPSDWAKAIIGRINVNAPGGNANIALSFIYSPEGDPTFGQTPSTSSLDIEQTRNTDYENSHAYVIDLWGQWKPKFANDKLLLAFDAVYGKVHDNYQVGTDFNGYTDEDGDYHEGDVGIGENADDFYGIALYAKYQITKVFSLAGRGEWFHDNDSTGRGFGDAYTGYDYDYRGSDSKFRREGFGVAPDDEVPMQHTTTDAYSFTLTAGFDLWENMLLRLEYRLDLLSSDGGEDEWYHENAFGNNNTDQHTFILNASYSF